MHAGKTDGSFHSNFPSITLSFELSNVGEAMGNFEIQLKKSWVDNTFSLGYIHSYFCL